MSMGHNTLAKIGNGINADHTIKIKAGETLVVETPDGVNKFSVDASGNVVAAGNISAGSTSSVGGDSAVFTGEVQANSLSVTGAASAAGVASTGRVTTTDGVASGTARVVGGRASAAIAANDNLLASAGASAHVDFAQTYSIPASTLKASSVLKISGSVACGQADGADTLEIKLYIGGTTLMTITAFDPSAVTDFANFEFELISRAAAGASVSCVGKGRWVTSDNGSLVHGAAILAATNLATNGALVVKASAKWSSTTALTNARLEMLNVEIV